MGKIELPHSAAASHRYRATVEYDGAEYCGFQWQPDAPTIQGAIEIVLKKLFDHEIRVSAAGRTDSGVHALGQVIHFDAPDKFSPAQLELALNGNLPYDIRVREVRMAPPDFHARYSAQWRWYRYRLFTRVRAVERQYGWKPKRMQITHLLPELADRLLGEHDFSAFCSADADPSPEDNPHGNCCLIYAAGWVEAKDEWRFHIVANRFLRHMVRYVVGAMVDTCRGRFAPDQFRDFLQQAKKSDDILSAPAQGLCLMRVGYAPYPDMEVASGQNQAYPGVLE
jgi:tRNA pseudouridine38-40 synthase